MNYEGLSAMDKRLLIIKYGSLKTKIGSFKKTDSIAAVCKISF